MSVVRLHPPLRFPAVCPGCCRMADSSRRLVLRKGSGGGQLFSFLATHHASYAKYAVDVPYCSGCNQRFRTLRLGLFLAAVLPGLVGFFFLGKMREWPAPLRIAGGLAFLATLLSPVWWFLIRDWLSDLRIRDVDPQTGALALAVKNADYAARLQKGS